MKIKKFLSFILAGAVVFSTATPLLASQNDGVLASVITVSDTVSYLTLDLTKYESTAKTIYLDDVVTSFSNVDNSGKILKAEFNGPHKKLKIEFNDGSIVEKEISSVYKKFPYKSSGIVGAPDVVTGHAITTVFDFHTIAKDESGNERKYPTTSTFDISGLKKKEIDVVTTPTTSTPKYLKGKDVVITYRFNGEESVKKFDNIKRVNILQGNKNTSVTFYKLKDVTSGKLGLTFVNGGALDTEGTVTVEIVYRNGKTDSKKIDILPSLPKTGNPNPTEAIKDTDVDYGKDVVFKYNLDNEEENKKFNSISSVTKVYSNGQEARLNLKKVTKGKVGELRILFSSSRPIQDKGTHNIKISYRGTTISPESKTFTYKKVSPEIILTADSGEYNVGKSIIFNLKGFEYLFQQDTGIQTVFLNGTELKRKRVIDNDENYEESKKNDPNVAENESENSWHVVGETFRIKNDGIKLIKKGVNYLTIKYDGYHDSNLTFVLSNQLKFFENDKIEKNSDKPVSKSAFRGVSSFRGVDAVTSGTSGGAITKPIMGGDTEGGGSIAMGFKVVFDFDMVANASILEKLGYINDGINRILNAWEGTSKEMALSKSNPNRKVVWDRYLTYVQKNRVGVGTYYSFNEYANSSNVSTTKNGYYLVKYAFPNGFGFPIYGMTNIFENATKDSVSVEKTKKILDTVRAGEDIVLPLDNWTMNISEILANGKALVKGQDYYEDYSNSNFIIKGKVFDKSGNVSIKITSKGEVIEKDVVVLERESSNDNVSLNLSAYSNNTVYSGQPLKFMVENKLQLNGIKITVKSKTKSRKYVLKSKDYKYYQSLGLLEIYKEKTLLPGKYTVEFDLAGYKKEVEKFEVVDRKLPIPKEEVPKSPDFDENVMNKKFPGMIYNVQRQTFTNDGTFSNFAKFVMGVNRVEVNGERVAPGSGFTRIDLGAYGIRIHRKLKKGDTITIYSNGFEPYSYFVREVKN